MDWKNQPKAKQSGHTKKRLNVKKHSKRSPSIQREGSLEANNNSDEEGENEIQHVRARPRLKQQKSPIRHLSFEEDEVEETIDSDPAGNESSDSRSDRAGKAKRKDHRKKLFSKLNQLGNKMISKFSPFSSFFFSFFLFSKRRKAILLQMTGQSVLPILFSK